MKNVKLTLATTLSVLALTFAGVASADNGSRYNNYKKQNEVSFNKKANNQKTSKQLTNKQKVSNKSYTKNANNSNTTAKRVVVKKTVIKSPTKKVVFTKNVKKPAKTQYVSKSRANTKYVTKYVTKGVTNKVVKRNVKPFAYTVRSGDTLYRISLKTGVSVNKLAKLNHITNWNINNIRIGQILRIS
ncbi:LysM peptidoglycan-binding domain-containing protein [uncultured Cocleimonas sp.]|uniref:LysM peptidoglycan-binding domain-containing protein n=1 Tax=uncultured Cocleimonas sp. TaxID=1051587 RepID=UPI00260DA014|nr:LysM peptidoglycan-binding domain-containing protein [uncultured Cocleimonas sp.]